MWKRERRGKQYQLALIDNVYVHMVKGISQVIHNSQAGNVDSNQDPQDNGESRDEDNDEGRGEDDNGGQEEGRISSHKNEEEKEVKEPQEKEAEEVEEDEEGEFDRDDDDRGSTTPRSDSSSD